MARNGASMVRPQRLWSVLPFSQVPLHKEIHAGPHPDLFDIVIVHFDVEPTAVDGGLFRIAT